MERVITKTRTVGNSVGVLIPNATLKREGLSVGQEVVLTIAPKVKKNIFGSLKGLFTPEDLDKFVEENKDAWGD